VVVLIGEDPALEVLYSSSRIRELRVLYLFRTTRTKNPGFLHSAEDCLSRVLSAAPSSKRRGFENEACRAQDPVRHDIALEEE